MGQAWIFHLNHKLCMNDNNCVMGVALLCLSVDEFVLTFHCTKSIPSLDSGFNSQQTTQETESIFFYISSSLVVECGMR